MYECNDVKKIIAGGKAFQNYCQRGECLKFFDLVTYFLRFQQKITTSILLTFHFYVECLPEHSGYRRN